MKRLSIVAFVAVVLAIVIVAALTYAPHAEGYSRFITRETNYFAGLAKACEQLLEETTSDPETERQINGNDETLSPILRQLHAKKIVVGSSLRIGANTNSYVIIRIGESRGGYGVVWAPQNGGLSDTWTLSANHESESKILFKETKPSAELGRQPGRTPTISP